MRHAGLRDVLAKVQVGAACRWPACRTAARTRSRLEGPSLIACQPAAAAQERDPYQPEFLAAVKEVAVALQPVFEKRPEMLPVGSTTSKLVPSAAGGPASSLALARLHALSRASPLCACRARPRPLLLPQLSYSLPPITTPTPPHPPPPPRPPPTPLARCLA